MRLGELVSICCFECKGMTGKKGSVPSCTSSPDKVKVFAWSWQLVKIQIVLDATHDLIEYQQLRHAADASAV
jgi:hypothetical protein